MSIKVQNLCYVLRVYMGKHIVFTYKEINDMNANANHWHYTLTQNSSFLQRIVIIQQL